MGASASVPTETATIFCHQCNTTATVTIPADSRRAARGSGAGAGAGGANQPAVRCTRCSGDFVEFVPTMSGDAFSQALQEDPEFLNNASSAAARRQYLHQQHLLQQQLAYEQVMLRAAMASARAEALGAQGGAPDSPASTGPPRASREFVENIPTIALSAEQVEDQDECVVCAEDFEVGEEVAQMPCQHFFHRACITQWLEKQNNCPVCRREVPAEEAAPIFPPASSPSGSIVSSAPLVYTFALERPQQNRPRRISAAGTTSAANASMQSPASSSLSPVSSAGSRSSSPSSSSRTVLQRLRAARDRAFSSSESPSSSRSENRAGRASSSASLPHPMSHRSGRSGGSSPAAAPTSVAERRRSTEASSLPPIRR